MPVEYVRSGASMNGSMPAKAMISSTRARMYARERPEQRAVEEDVLAAGELRLESRPELHHRRHRSAASWPRRPTAR